MDYLNAEAVAVVVGDTLKVIHLAYSFKAVEPTESDTL
jgi:hypothetical protein